MDRLFLTKTKVAVSMSYLAIAIKEYQQVAQAYYAATSKKSYQIATDT